MGFKILTVGEMPSHNHTASSNWAGEHNHSINAYQSGTGTGQHISYYERYGNTIKFYTNNGGGHSHTITVNNNGSNQAHNNLQPYISVYMWQRTE